MKIYIVLSYTGSLPSKIIRLFSKKRYTHVSISLNRELTDMYSFGRRYLRLPLPGGFVKENITEGLYNKEKVPIIVKELPISEEQYKRLLDLLEDFQVNPVHYDYKGAIGIHFHKNFFGEYGYVCSSFAREVLTEIGIEVSKNNWEIEPEDFLNLLDGSPIYEGLSLDYR